MAKFTITPTTTVAELKEQYSNEVGGGVLRVYDGRSEAADDATLVSLGAKEGELECRTSRTVGKFEEAFQDELNLKVKVYTPDNWVKVLDGITLAAAAELPKGMTKEKMEEYLSYQRDEKEETELKSEESNTLNHTTTNQSIDMSDKITELEEELHKILAFATQNRIQELFFEIIPDGTYIYSTNDDYEKQKVAYAIDCAVVDFDENCSRFLKAIQFQVKDQNLYVTEYLNNDEDEIENDTWNALDGSHANYEVLSRLLELYTAGKHSDSPVSLIPQCEAEDEDEEEEE